MANSLILLVPGAGIEPAQPLGPRDFKSLASTYSATRADGLMVGLMEEFVYWILEMRRYFKQKRNFVFPRKRGSLNHGPLML